MNPKIILLLLAILAIAIASYPSTVEEKKVINISNFQEFAEINMTILKEANECFGVNLTTNTSCEKYNFDGDETVDIRDLTIYTHNESLRARINAIK